MNSAFTVDEIAESFWTETTAAGAMNHHSHSEWAFERLMQEVSRGPISPTSSATCDRIAPATSCNSKRLAEVDKNETAEQRLDQSAKAPVGSDDQRALLLAQLDRACAAVARSRASAVKPGESGALPEGQLPVTKPVPLGSQALGPVHVVSTVQSASDSTPRGVAALSSTQRNAAAVQVKQTTSESSREDSEDDEVEGDTGTTNDPAEVKRVRRMQSNRESARRSRRRKQEHMNELETQVGQLKVEHTTLLKRLTDINSNFDKASVDNRVLKADIETLRTKVKMAEETVKRVTGINPLLLAMSNLHGTGGMPPFVGNPMDTFAMPGQHQPPPPPNPNNHHYFHHQPPFPHNPSLDIGNLQQNEDGGPNSMPLPSIPGLPSNRKPQ